MFSEEGNAIQQCILAVSNTERKYNVFFVYKKLYRAPLSFYSNIKIILKYYI